MTVIVTAALLSLLLTGLYVQLAKRLGWGKRVRRDGPASHHSKEGTPTMGGLALLLAAAVTVLVGGFARGDSLALLALIGGSSLLGLADDLTALRRRAGSSENATTGLLARYRLLVQALIALGFAIYAQGRGYGPFDIAALDVLIMVLAIVGSINALNFSDGLDGLAAGMTAIMLLLFTASPVALALLGSLLGFLWYNANPARVFMGGVGSEALGAAVAGLAIVHGMLWYLPLIALVPVLEVLSVIVQVGYFRATGGRRLLRMSPLHHHFELSGWSEVQVVTRFWLFTAVCVALAWALIGGGR